VRITASRPWGVEVVASELEHLGSNHELFVGAPCDPTTTLDTGG
jgi:hypothetical protein